MSVAAAFRGMSAVRVPACRGISPLAAIPDRQSGDGRPQRVVRREDSVIPVPILARRRDRNRADYQGGLPVPSRSRSSTSTTTN